MVGEGKGREGDGAEGEGLRVALFARGKRILHSSKGEEIKVDGFATRVSTYSLEKCPSYPFSYANASQYLTRGSVCWMLLTG